MKARVRAQKSHQIIIAQRPTGNLNYNILITHITFKILVHLVSNLPCTVVVLSLRVPASWLSLATKAISRNLGQAFCEGLCEFILWSIK